ncbi:DUF4869 domain-containing protein [Pseudobutyrivibrio sp.]|uniref:DUF4869 domain-containing protein n=1 Tax=Pseudobutyrivibrio sp. TaxID=2014367 RepID=UPI0025E5F1B8|nr:DUF4869 domain-containing protein [Pseudobutyrivibrio sp.]
MITIYKNKKYMPNAVCIDFNDVYFNQYTSREIDERAKPVIAKIDGATLVEKYKFKSIFNAELLDIDKLSSGCKTALNILYFPNALVSIKECGDNALSVIFGFEEGNVYSDYPLIPFEFDSVCVSDENGKRIIKEYDELKTWWENEN